MMYSPVDALDDLIEKLNHSPRSKGGMLIDDFIEETGMDIDYMIQYYDYGNKHNLIPRALAGSYKQIILIVVLIALVSSYDRNLVITAGDMEDEDYEEYYGDNDSTLEGVRHLEDRLKEHGVNAYKVKIYQSHHYQYVPDLLMEYLTDTM